MKNKIAKRLCSICARGGSKGVKNKNIRPLLGIPLVAHSILQARETNLFDFISVSSDSDEILNIAKKFGADFLHKRPTKLANDLAGKIPAIQNCVNESEKFFNQRFDFIIDLDFTSPLRQKSDIFGVTKLLEVSAENDQEVNIITGAPARRSPYFNLVEESQSGFVHLSKNIEGNHKIIRRQDSPRCYDMNASIYGWTRYSLLNLEGVISHKTKLFVMPEERSFDIDCELDFEIVEMIMRKKLGKEQESRSKVRELEGC